MLTVKSKLKLKFFLYILATILTYLVNRVKHRNQYIRLLKVILIVLIIQSKSLSGELSQVSMFNQ